MLLRHARTSLALCSSFAAAIAITIVAAAPASASTFEDTAGSTAQEAVDALAEEGVFSGCREGEFCPHRPLTRAQMASVLVAALELPTGEALLAADSTAVDVFADIAGSSHADSITALAAAGVVGGCETDAYCPRQPLTRGQMATMIAEAFELPPTSEQFFDDGGDTHGDAVNRLAAAGISAGCGDPLTAFCTHEPVLRSQSAMFLARAMDLVDPVELSPLTERRAQQEEIDAARAAAEAEAKAAAEAEAAAKAEAEAKAAADKAAARGKIWDALARCESGGNWSINTGNGYYGGLQFSISSWRGAGGSGYPHQASRTEQIRRGEVLLRMQGWGAWPSCSRKLGYR